MVRQAYYSIRTKEDDPIMSDGAPIPSLDEVVHIDKKKIIVNLRYRFLIDMDDVIDARVGREWKIDGFRIVE